MSATNYKPCGGCVLANVATTASTVYVNSDIPVGAWLVTNAGTNDVFFRLSVTPTITAAIPVTSGTSSPGQLINAGDTYILGLPSADGNGSAQWVSNVAISSMTQTGSSQLFINPVQFLNN
jgi:hypothetical protein